jgi:hypothetical protein
MEENDVVEASGYHSLASFHKDPHLTLGDRLALPRKRHASEPALLS